MWWDHRRLRGSDIETGRRPATRWINRSTAPSRLSSLEPTLAESWPLKNSMSSSANWGWIFSSLRYAVMAMTQQKALWHLQNGLGIGTHFSAPMWKTMREVDVKCSWSARYMTKNVCQQIFKNQSQIDFWPATAVNDLWAMFNRGGKVWRMAAEHDDVCCNILKWK